MENRTVYDKFLLKGEALPAANALIVPKFESTSEWTGVWAHEYFHFLQFAGTRTGQLLSFMFAFVGHSAGAFLREPPDLLKKTLIWRFPLLLWCTFEKDASTRRSLRKHFTFLIFETQTINLHLGILPIFTKGNRWNPELPWPWATLPPKDKVLPELVLENSHETILLSTLNIMETAAAIQGLRMEDSEILFNSNHIGFVLTEMQYQRLMRAHIRYSVGLRFVEKHTHISHLFSASITLLAADIALTSGIDELSETKKGRPSAWEDWYPGWRFVKAVKAIEDLIVNEGAWPRSEGELSGFLREIEARCHCVYQTRDIKPLYVFNNSPSAADRVRQRLSEEAIELRKEHESLWSVGPREQILEASLKWFRPPIFMHYGSDTIHAGRSDLDSSEISELWADAQLQHIAWQLIGNTNTIRCCHHVECFFWSKEGSDSGCTESTGNCRWFPPISEKPLPDSCPMLRIIKRLAGPYWNRLQPM